MDVIYVESREAFDKGPCKADISLNLQIMKLKPHYRSIRTRRHRGANEQVL